ncbi:hypothetical protein BV22DRAFT_869301 [Leucogyrophana mollusca]|uniref:Uncharacterized protein n=1 Tax=Leucogyrophana mollusca TaxID=85980 RepID=A0ACB8B1L1_9AGAM|nr:hypothetical protein BV22DRAFT_869301 [Leucogyrophana mollusca]
MFIPNVFCFLIYKQLVIFACFCSVLPASSNKTWIPSHRSPSFIFTSSTASLFLSIMHITFNFLVHMYALFVPSNRIFPSHSPCHIYTTSSPSIPGTALSCYKLSRSPHR